jgi:hypothetical protein
MRYLALIHETSLPRTHFYSHVLIFSSLEFGDYYRCYFSLRMGMLLSAFIFHVISTCLSRLYKPMYFNVVLVGVAVAPGTDERHLNYVYFSDYDFALWGGSLKF